MRWDHIAYGWSAEEICRQHPYLTLSEAHAALLYYFDHRDEIEAEIQQELKQLDEMDAEESRSPFYLRMRVPF